jgi:2-succinyl-5-enolpyruvyl-6-hydroxy-3-cyclohexene-1-carboxylate synthase
MKVSDKISVRKIVEQCQLHGIQDIVISPGSRNAPFTLSFTNNPFFTCYSIVDERSASHFALGIAQQKNKPVAIVSTSGTATLNYAPAIAEAHMQGIPLLVITADRQSDGLEIGDGQVLNQKEIYANFCENNYNLVEDENDEKELNSAIIQEGFYGLIDNKKTVHLNVQLSEPLYGVIEMESFDAPYKNEEVEVFQTVSEKSEELINTWNSYSSKLILVFQNQYKNLQSGLERLMELDKNVVVVTETTGDVVSDGFNSCIDRTIELIDKTNPEGFIPDLIVTIGHSVISKKIKQLFRTHKPKAHWSFSKVRNENLFQMETIEKRTEENEFLALISSKGISKNETNDFKTNWDLIKTKSEEGHLAYLSQTSFSDIKAFEFLTKNLPSCNLQMGNSSVVRYIQLFNQRADIKYNSNRGVSGIEGCTSTALGAHHVTNNSILISGDISFFYDSNAFWNRHVPNDFKLIVINNGEGNIFKILPHPKKDKVSLPFFTTPHKTSIKKFCDLYGVRHFVAKNQNKLESVFENFIKEKSQASVLEIDTSSAENDTILTDYFTFINQYKN